MTAEASAAAAEARIVAPLGDRAFFGHPRGLAFILGTETGWAFGYFGLQMILTLYMTQDLLKPGHVEHVLGFGAYRALLESVFGRLSPLALASQTFGLATGLIYAMPIVGGFLADRWIGQRRAVIAALLTLTAAHLLLIGERTFLIALALMVLGTGLLKTSLIGQLGRLYAPDDDRRTRAFGLYLIALNVGSMTTPLIAGTLAEKFGWSLGLAAMALGIGLGTLCYLAGLRHMPADTRRPRADAPRPRLRRADRRVVVILLLMMALDGVFLGVYDQAFNVFPVWADAHVERHVLGFLVPVTWFTTLDGSLTIVGTAFAVRIWAWRTSRGGNATDLRRVAIGFALAMLGFLVLALGASLAGPGKAPLAPEILFFLCVDFSIPWIDTVILTMVSRDAPRSIATTVLGAYYLALAGGNFLTGWLGALADHMPITAFWAMHAAIFAAVLLFLIVCGKALSRALSASEEREDAVTNPVSLSV
ncbi:MAG TPA: MFS transporter [Rhizomicrobium sp.]